MPSHAEPQTCCGSVQQADLQVLLHGVACCGVSLHHVSHHAAHAVVHFIQRRQRGLAAAQAIGQQAGVVEQRLPIQEQLGQHTAEGEDILQEGRGGASTAGRQGCRDRQVARDLAGQARVRHFGWPASAPPFPSLTLRPRTMAGVRGAVAACCGVMPAAPGS